MKHPQPLRQFFRLLLSGLLLLNWGCVHRIHVTPAPPATSTAPIARSLQVIVPFLAVEGADRMPGIALFEWPARDLRAAVIDYVQSRLTFTSASDKPADLTMTVKAWLRLRADSRYQYKLRLETTLDHSKKQPIKSYLVEKDAAGQEVRWSTASDQAPIAEAVQAALDDLLTQIEADRLRLETTLDHSKKKPIKSYLVEKDAAGQEVRWSTASDQAPIAEAVQAALDDLLTQIEADRLLY
ncbi:MAG: hypothetical protein ITD36_00015 [Nitrospira sp.]|nr:hypothetical protein [Nitrospira sp.]